MIILLKMQKLHSKTALDTKKAVFRKVRNSKLRRKIGCVSPQLVLNNEFALKKSALNQNKGMESYTI